MRKNPPKTVYVSRAGSGNDAFLCATEKWDEHAERGSVTRVGVYKLERVIEVTTSAKIVKDSGAR